MAVYDPGTDMPGVVHQLHGSVVRLVRPAGYVWDARAIAVRPATDRERRQLRALAALHRKQRGRRDGRPA